MHWEQFVWLALLWFSPYYGDPELSSHFLQSMPLLLKPKAIYSFSVIPIKLLIACFTELEKTILKFVWNHKRFQIASLMMGGAVLLCLTGYLAWRYPAVEFTDRWSWVLVLWWGSLEISHWLIFPGTWSSLLVQQLELYAATTGKSGLTSGLVCMNSSHPLRCLRSPLQCLVGALLMRRCKLHVLLLCHLTLPPPNNLEKTEQSWRYHMPWFQIIL